MNDEQTLVQLRIFDVGQGLCQILSFMPSEGGEPIFIVADAGPLRSRNNADPFQFLARYRKPKIKALIISHNDSDHYSGALLMAQAFSENIETVYFPNDRPAEAMRLYNCLIEEKNRGRFKGDIREALVNQGDPARLIAREGAAYLYLLAPDFPTILNAQSNANAVSRTNRCSAILALHCGPTIVLMPGDADRPALQILERYEDCKADVLIAPHHGGKLTPNGQVEDDYIWLLQKVLKNPKHVIFSVSSTNIHGHPDAGAFAACRRSGAAILCTQMTSQCHRNLHSLMTHSPFTLPDYSRSNHGKASCVGCYGTIRVSLGDSGYEIERHSARMQEIKRRMADDYEFLPKCVV